MSKKRSDKHDKEFLSLMKEWDLLEEATAKAQCDFQDELRNLGLSHQEFDTQFSSFFHSSDKEMDQKFEEYLAKEGWNEDDFWDYEEEHFPGIAVFNEDFLEALQECASRHPENEDIKELISRSLSNIEKVKEVQSK